jgi:hypothetical protein
MPEVKIEGNWDLQEAVVIHDQVITLWKYGQRIDVPVESAAVLQADGWQSWNPDVGKLSRELQVWCDALGKSSLNFSKDAEDMGLINAAEGAPFHILVKAKRMVDEAYEELSKAAFLIYKIGGQE